jgi:hypothetical protein
MSFQLFATGLEIFDASNGKKHRPKAQSVCAAEAGC